MVNRLGKLAGDELGLETWITPMVPFLIVDNLGMSLACTTFIFIREREDMWNTCSGTR